MILFPGGFVALSCLAASSHGVFHRPVRNLGISGMVTLSHEVHAYASNPAFEIYDLRQERLAAGLLFWAGLGLAISAFNFFGRIRPLILTTPSQIGTFSGLAIITWAVIWYRRAWNRNAAQFEAYLELGQGADGDPAGERGA